MLAVTSSVWQSRADLFELVLELQVDHLELLLQAQGVHVLGCLFWTFTTRSERGLLSGNQPTFFSHPTLQNLFNFLEQCHIWKFLQITRTPGICLEFAAILSRFRPSFRRKPTYFGEMSMTFWKLKSGKIIEPL